MKIVKTGKDAENIFKRKQFKIYKNTYENKIKIPAKMENRKKFKETISNLINSGEYIMDL